MAEDWTKFPPIPAPSKSVRGLEPLLVGLLGPPGSGKTRSMLRMMRGVQRVFPGPLVVVDTEAGRSRKYSPREGEAAQPDHSTQPTYDFERIDLDPPFRGDRCWAAIKSGLALKPAALGFDNLSDEHSGEGGYLWWHDEEVERVGGNEWAAWARPSAARKRLLTGISHVAAPPVLFFTFISEEKTEQIEVKDDRTGRNKKKVVNKGWTPVAPLLIVKTLDLTCILPWDSKGTPIWESRKLPHEDFIRKWPDQFREIMTPGQITEAHGEALARWVLGSPRSSAGDGSRTGADLLEEVGAALVQAFGAGAASKAAKQAALEHAFGPIGWKAIQALPADQLETGLASLKTYLVDMAEMQQRQPGEDPGTEAPL